MPIARFDDLRNLKLTGKRILVRGDMNVPMRQGEILSDARLLALLPTLRFLCQRQAKVILLSHLGRPSGRADEAFSLRLVVPALSRLLQKNVLFCPTCLGSEAKLAVERLALGEILVLENLRFHPGEEADDPDFAQALAQIGDIYVNDAFSAAHRAHASITGLARRLPAYPGLSMEHELNTLNRVLNTPKRPLVAIIGGAKVSSKLTILENLASKVDSLVIAGAMANTFLRARGKRLGRSLVEDNLLDRAREIEKAITHTGAKLILPVDGMVAPGLEAGQQADLVSIDAIKETQMLLDLGIHSVAAIFACLQTAKTLIWNGPLGAFEHEPFARATQDVAAEVVRLVRHKGLLAVAGGGDTHAALGAHGQGFSFLSNAGGAFLEWLEGKRLPGITALEDKEAA